MLCRVVLAAGLWFSVLGIFLTIFFWLGAFPLRSKLLTLLGLPCMLLPVFPLLPLRFFLCLGFCHFNYDASCSGPLWVPLAWDSLCFLDLGECSLIRLGKFSIISFSNRFSIPCSSSSPLVFLLYRYYYVSCCPAFPLFPLHSF